MFIVFNVRRAWKHISGIQLGQARKQCWSSELLQKKTIQLYQREGDLSSYSSDSIRRELWSHKISPVGIHPVNYCHFVASSSERSH